MPVATDFQGTDALLTAASSTKAATMTTITTTTTNTAHHSTHWNASQAQGFPLHLLIEDNQPNTHGSATSLPLP